jgi:hypothetical protein
MNGLLISGGTTVSFGEHRICAYGSRIGETSDMFGLKGATRW